MALAPFSTRYAPAAMVCSVDHLATVAGIAALKAGGTAVDAAIATSAVLAVTAPHMCGMGGDLWAIVAPPGGVPEVCNASGAAGSGADPVALRAEGHTTMPFRGDIRSVPVPGCVDGWCALHERHGRLPLAEVLSAAITYAEAGFPASPLLAGAAPAVADVAGAGDLRPGGRPLRPGDLVRRPGVGAALRAIAEGGRDAFYLGPFGEGLLELGGGEYVPDDLRRHHASWVEPVVVDTLGHRVWAAPPNSQAYLVPAALRVAELVGIPAEPDDDRWAHVLIEAARAAGHDRPAVLAEGVDGAVLVGEERLAARAAGIDPERTTGGPWSPAPGGTIALCVVAPDGTGVSLLQSNASGFGAHIVEPATGIFLHNRGIGFSLEPGHPAEYGPGRRPPSTLSPVVVTRPDGALAVVTGTMGGDSQPQVLLQLLCRLLVAGQSPGVALAAGRWRLAGVTGFDTWTVPGGPVVEIEGHASRRWAHGLEARGHRVRLADAFDHSFGHAHAIVVRPDGLAGAADPRARVGTASGF